MCLLEQCFMWSLWNFGGAGGDLLWSTHWQIINFDCKRTWFCNNKRQTGILYILIFIISYSRVKGVEYLCKAVNRWNDKWLEIEIEKKIKHCERKRDRWMDGCVCVHSCCCDTAVLRDWLQAMTVLQPDWLVWFRSVIQTRRDVRHCRVTPLGEHGTVFKITEHTPTNHPSTPPKSWEVGSCPPRSFNVTER